MTAPLKSNWVPDEEYDANAINAVANRINANTVPHIVMYPRQSIDYGNGLDGRVIGASLADATLTAAYTIGVNGPWSSVDVWVAWMDSTALDANVVMSTYLGRLVDGVRPQSTVVSNAKLFPTTTGVGSRYHETLVASSVAAVPYALLHGTVARDGANAADTYTGTVGIIAMIIKPHAD